MTDLPMHCPLTLQLFLYRQLPGCCVGSGDNKPSAMFLDCLPNIGHASVALP